MAVQIGLLLLIRYDDTVKIEPTNDAVMPYSPFAISFKHSPRFKTDLEKKNHTLQIELFGKLQQK